MVQVSQERNFNLRVGGVECGSQGLRIGGLPLLARTQNDTIWQALPKQLIEKALASAYGMEVDASDKLRGIELVAVSLSSGELARAQVVALLLQLPDPGVFKSIAPNHPLKAMWLSQSGLLGKEWIEADHPRIGTPPNPGWFATQSGGLETAPVSSNVAEQRVAILTTNFNYACKVLKLDRNVASDVLHKLKESLNLRGDDDCTFDTETGDVFINGEHIGNFVE